MAGRTKSLRKSRWTVLTVAVAVASGLAFGTGPARAVVFANSAPISVPVPGTPNVTPASLYPSNIAVSELTGTVTDVNVTLCGLSATFPSDTDVMLVGPTGAKATIMSDAGGDAENDPPVSGITLLLDGQAMNQLPVDTALTSGTFRPVDDDDDAADITTTDSWPAPAPAPAAGFSLDVFNGTDPNGTWSLYVVDDFPGTGGEEPTRPIFTCGWSVDILTTGGGTTTTTIGGTTTTSTTVVSTTTTSTSTTVVSTTTTSTSTTVVSTTTTSTIPPRTTCDGRTPTIVGTDATETIIGTPGDDVIVGRGGHDTIYGRGGNDRICGEGGVDRIFGEDGDDRIFGDDGADAIDGGAGNDALFGNAGVDRLLGGPGNDSLDAGPDYDNCLGQDGTDTATGCEAIISVP